MKTYIYCLMLILCSIGIFASSPYPNSNPYGAVRIFHFDSATGTTLVDSLGNENGALYNIEDLDWTTSQSNFGNAITLDNSNEYADIQWGNGDFDIYNITHNYSICWWDKQYGTVGSFVMGASNAAGIDFLVPTYATDRRVAVHLAGGGNDFQKRFNESFDTAKTTFTQRCIVLNGTRDDYNNVNLYVNGTLQTTTQELLNSLNAQTYLTKDLFLNAYNNNGVATSFIGGTYDDLLIFTKALDDGQIITIYTGNYSGGTTPTTGGNVVINFNTNTNYTINYQDNTVSGVGTTVTVGVPTIKHGKTEVRFKTTAQNVFYQSYELLYGDTSNTVELYTLPTPVVQNYIRVLDQARNPIPESEVLIKQTSITSGNTTFNIIGRVFTDANGDAVFGLQPHYSTRITVAKSGYSMIDQQLMYINESNTAYTRKEIIMSLDSQTNLSFMEIIPNWFTNRTENIYGKVITDKTVSYTTDYAMSKGYTNTTATIRAYIQNLQDKSIVNYLYGYDRLIVLVPDLHFNSTSNESIELYYTVGNQVFQNKTIEFIHSENISKMLDVNEIDAPPEWLSPLLFIGLILLVIVTQSMFKSESQSIGKNTFFILSILLATIPPFRLLPLALIAVTYFLAQPLKTFVGERM